VCVYGRWGVMGRRGGAGGGMLFERWAVAEGEDVVVLPPSVACSGLNGEKLVVSMAWIVCLMLAFMI